MVCKSEQFDPDLIKLDVEGYEYKCLLGLSDTIDRCRPVFFLEIHPEMMAPHGESPADVVGFFEKKNYVFLDLHSRKAVNGEMRRLTETTRKIVCPAESDLAK